MTQCTTTTRRDKPLAPVSVQAHWLVLPTTADMASEVAIEDAKLSTFYAMHAHLDQRSGEICGYRLTKRDGEFHDIDPVAGTWGAGCSCEDATFRPNRPGGCRHIAALTQLLASLDDALAAAERAELERQQAEDRCDEAFYWPDGTELEAMAAELAEEDAARLLHDEAEADRLYADSVADAEMCGSWFGVGA